MGLLTAFIGVMFLGSGWIIAGSFTSIATLIVVALAFGAGQERVTRILDNKLTAMVRAGSGTIATPTSKVAITSTSKP